MKNTKFYVDVAPEMQLYRILQKQSYGEETAISEFVDNSIQSFIDNSHSLKELDSGNSEFKVIISINTQEKTITIEDNAAGIKREQLQQALKMGRDSSTPHLQNSLSAYGMGLKSAAIWFSDTWQLETSSLNSNEKLTLLFDLENLLANNYSQIETKVSREEIFSHYTKITIFNHNRNDSESYYKDIVLPFLLETFFKFQQINITVIHNDLVLHPNPKNIFISPNPPLIAKKYNHQGQIEDSNSSQITWEKNIDFESNRRRVYGFIRLMTTGKYRQPGIRLFRNNRVIKGTVIHNNLPEIITGTKNKYGAQRIYGEIHLNEFSVNYQKTDFDEDLNGIYSQIRGILTKEPNLIIQAGNYRSRYSSKGSTGSSTSDTTGSPTNNDSQQRRKNQAITKIKRSNKIYDALQNTNNTKLVHLYQSLCTVSLVEHPILMYAGTWSFLETLSSAIGKQENVAFNGFFNSKVPKNIPNKKDIKNSINDIHSKGNASKHSNKAYQIDAKQLHNDFEVLEGFIVVCIRQIN